MLAALSLTAFAAGCGAATIPDPKDAVTAYAEAAAKGDSDAIYEMLSEKSRRGLSRDEVKKLVADERAQLGDQAKAVTAPGVVVKARAKVRYGDGEDASLEARRRRLPHRHRRRAPRRRSHPAPGALAAPPRPRAPQLRRPHAGAHLGHAQRHREQMSAPS